MHTLKRTTPQSNITIGSFLPQHSHTLDQYVSCNTLSRLGPQVGTAGDDHLPHGARSRHRVQGNCTLCQHVHAPYSSSMPITGPSGEAVKHHQHIFSACRQQTALPQIPNKHAGADTNWQQSAPTCPCSTLCVPLVNTQCHFVNTQIPLQLVAHEAPLDSDTLAAAGSCCIIITPCWSSTTTSCYSSLGIVSAISPRGVQHWAACAAACQPLAHSFDGLGIRLYELDTHAKCSRRGQGREKCG
jgi:hypothetical protein